MLNLLPAICELSRNGLACYGGNYDFYKEQKEVHRNALQQQLEEKEKALRLARKTAREMEERKARQNTRGEKASIKKGIPRILLGGLKNHAENSSSKLSNVHAEKTDKIQQEITNLKGSLPQTNKQAENRLQCFGIAYRQNTRHGTEYQLSLSGQQHKPLDGSAQLSATQRQPVLHKRRTHLRCTPN